MKPSEKRALQAEKRARAEAEARAKESKKEADDPMVAETADDDAVGGEYEWGSHQSEEKVNAKPYKRKEGFFQSHVRLITFIVTTVFLFLFVSPFAVDMIVKFRNDKTVHNMQDIDIESVYSIYDNAEIIEWKNFRNFNYTDYSYDAKEGKYFVREYPVSNSRLVLKVGGPSLDPKPDYIQLIDYRTGQYINVFNEDPRDFIKTLDLEE